MKGNRLDTGPDSDLIDEATFLSIHAPRTDCDRSLVIVDLSWPEDGGPGDDIQLVTATTNSQQGIKIMRGNIAERLKESFEAQNQSQGSPGTAWAMTRRGALVCLCAFLALGISSTFAGKAERDSHQRGLSTFTANAYIGADLAPAVLLDPTDPNYLAKLVQTVTGIYMGVLASDPPTRMAGLAREIAALQPEIVGLEEVWTLEKAPMTETGAPGQFSVVYDYLQLLTNALAACGAHYQVVVVATESDITMPMFDVQAEALAFGRIVDHEVILARADLPPGHLRVSNPQSGQFANYLQFPTGLSLLRGWCSVDVFSRGERLRFICTHLEEETVPQLQVLQANELLSGPAHVQMPVILVGDFNADPLHRDGSVAYDEFIQDGFKDSWSVVHPRQPTGGLTWGHDAELANPRHQFDRRIDLVFYRGHKLKATEIEVVDPGLHRSHAPLWPSDHAAVTAEFRFGEQWEK